MPAKIKELTEQLEQRDKIIALKDDLINKLMNDLKVMSERVESLTKKVTGLEMKHNHEREFQINQSDDSNSPPLQKKWRDEADVNNSNYSIYFIVFSFSCILRKISL